VFSIIGGILVVVGGIIAVPSPGPGWLIVLLGMGTFAGESQLVARFMDRAEVGLRELASWVMNFWASLSAAVKVLVVLLILACAVASGYVTFYLFSAENRGISSTIVLSFPSRFAG
jgi:hypothetical protein